MTDLNTPLGDPQGTVAAALANGSTVLHPHPALHIEERQMLETLRVGVNDRLKYRGTWTANTAYAVNDIVLYIRTVGTPPVNETGGRLYRCITAHSSGASFDFARFVEFATTSAFSDANYLIRPWAANTNYKAGAPAIRPTDGALIVAKVQFTSGTTYADINWTAISAGSGGATTGTLDTPVALTGTYTLQLTDAGKTLEVDSAATPAIFLPPHSVVPIPVGSVVRVRMIGDSQPVIRAGAAVSIRTPKTLRPRTKWSTIRMHKRGWHEWVLEEDLADSVPIPSTVTGNVGVTFSSVDHVIDPLTQIGYAVSGYTGQGGDIRYATDLQSSARALGAGVYRFAVKWNAAANKPYAGSNGGQNDAAGADAWIAGINSVKAAGAIIVGIIEGETEMGATPADCTNIVNYANANGWGIKNWVIGNEPELNTSKIDYKGRVTTDGRTAGDLFCELGAAVKAADATAKLWGPAASSYGGKAKSNTALATTPGAMGQFFNDFLNASGYGTSVAELLDVLCWHKYLSGNSGQDTSTNYLMGLTGGHYGEIVDAKTLINNIMPARASQIKYSLNEWNIFYQPANGRQGIKDENGVWYDERPTVAEGTVMVASAIRNSMRATNNYFVFFGDIVGPLGLWTRNPYDLNATPQLKGDNMGPGGLIHYPHGRPVLSPYSTYWALVMYTGGGLFRRFGANIPVQLGHGIANLEVQASTDNGGDVVLINKDDTVTRRINLQTTGVASGPVDIWQTQRHAPFDPPVRVAQGNIVSSAIEVVLPPMTVTRVIITPTVGFVQGGTTQALTDTGA